MVKLKIYAEGGGSGQFLDTLFRQGWSDFFRAAGFDMRMPKVVRGRGRYETFDLFRRAVEAPRSDELPLLLVDSEAPVAAGHTAWQHLKKRDGWDRPDKANADQAFLMVQVMETWFLADYELLHTYFGPELRDKHLRKWPALEEVPKKDVLAALARATRQCTRPFAKGKVSFELLARLSPARVEEACPHAKALLERLRSAG